MSLDGNRALVGAYHYDSEEADNAGAAYMFEADGGQWDQIKKLVAEDLMPTIASVRRCHLTGTARSSERSEKMCSGTTKRVRRTCSQKNLRKILPQ